MKENRKNIESAEEASVAIWDCGSPLYDSYELVLPSHVIERHLMVLPSLDGSKRLTTTHNRAPSSSAISLLSNCEGRKLLKMRVGVGEPIDKRKRLKRLGGIYKAFGFWKKWKYNRS